MIEPFTTPFLRIFGYAFLASTAIFGYGKTRLFDFLLFHYNILN